MQYQKRCDFTLRLNADNSVFSYQIANDLVFSSVSSMESFRVYL